MPYRSALGLLAVLDPAVAAARLARAPRPRPVQRASAPAARFALTHPRAMRCPVFSIGSAPDIIEMLDVVQARWCADARSAPSARLTRTGRAWRDGERKDSGVKPRPSQRRLDAIRHQLAVTRKHWRKAQLLFIANIVVMTIIGVLRGAWVLPLSFWVVLGPLILLGERLVRRCDWETNPLLRCLRESPERIATVKHRIITGPAGAFPHSFFVVRDQDGNRFVFRVPDADKPFFALALKHIATYAHFSGPGFDRDPGV